MRDFYIHGQVFTTPNRGLTLEVPHSPHDSPLPPLAKIILNVDYRHLTRATVEFVQFVTSPKRLR